MILHQPIHESSANINAGKEIIVAFLMPIREPCSSLTHVTSRDGLFMSGIVALLAHREEARVLGLAAAADWTGILVWSDSDWAGTLG